MMALKNNFRARWCLVLIIPFLSACSMFSPVKARHYNQYVINTTPHVARKPYHHETLYVSPVKADILYDTSDMAYTANSYRVEYFAKNKWAEKPAKMLQPLILRTLQKTEYFKAVTSSAAIRYDYALNIQINELRQVFYAHSSYVIFRMHAEIVDAATGKIIASKELKSEVPVCAMTPFGGVVAANQAVAITLKKLVNLCYKAILA